MEGQGDWVLRTRSLLRFCSAESPPVRGGATFLITDRVQGRCGKKDRILDAEIDAVAYIQRIYGEKTLRVGEKN